MKANFKVPHATSNKPKKPHQDSNFVKSPIMRLEPTRSRTNLQSYSAMRYCIVQRGHVPRRITHARAGIKSRCRAVRSLSTAGAAEQDWRSWRRLSGPGTGPRSGGGRIRTGADRGRADPGRGGAAVGVELAEDKMLVTGLDGPREYSGAGGGRVDAVRRSRSTDLELCTHRHVLSNMHLGGR